VPKNYKHLLCIGGSQNKLVGSEIFGAAAVKIDFGGRGEGRGDDKKCNMIFW